MRKKFNWNALTVFILLITNLFFFTSSCQQLAIPSAPLIPLVPMTNIQIFNSAVSLSSASSSVSLNIAVGGIPLTNLAVALSSPSTLITIPFSQSTTLNGNVYAIYSGSASLLNAGVSLPQPITLTITNGTVGVTDINAYTVAYASNGASVSWSPASSSITATLQVNDITNPSSLTVEVSTTPPDPVSLTSSSDTYEYNTTLTILDSTIPGALTNSSLLWTCPATFTFKNSTSTSQAVSWINGFP
jgi:hypothetical protein